MFSTVARLKYDDRKNKGEEVIAVSSVPLGRPFCSALQTCVISLWELSNTSAISHFLEARRFFFHGEAVRDSACSQSVVAWSALFLPWIELSIFLIFSRIDVAYHRSAVCFVFWGRSALISQHIRNKQLSECIFQVCKIRFGTIEPSQETDYKFFYDWFCVFLKVVTYSHKWVAQWCLM